MRDSKKPKLSEIRVRTKRACEKGQYHYFPAASHALFHDIPGLLDLVSRMGKVLYHYRAICSFCKRLPQDSDMLCYGCEKTRALLEEIKK